MEEGEEVEYTLKRIDFDIDCYRKQWADVERYKIADKCSDKWVYTATPLAEVYKKTDKRSGSSTSAAGDQWLTLAQALHKLHLDKRAATESLGSHTVALALFSNDVRLKSNGF
ncbi:unnamed protein product [Strongylus vulgaris]|uniref:Uncharacterized protein n=1 Tax=Strongylus vulgaris TaxID=40348 RepID=A0A3P7L3V3_STRVU|nr:unnamed protein product [Strongylus vulgaris]